MKECHPKTERIKGVSCANHQISGDMCMFRGRIKSYRIVYRKVRFEKRFTYTKCKIHVFFFDLSYGCLSRLKKTFHKQKSNR